MKKLEYSIRGLLYLVANVVYFAAAAWVGEGQYDQNGVRGIAAFFWFCWNFIAAVVIEVGEVPQDIVKALLAGRNTNDRPPDPPHPEALAHVVGQDRTHVQS